MKDVMIKLTKEQHDELARNARGAIQFVDPFTGKEYVLLLADVFEQFASLVRPFEELWNDPGMDDYDRYEEIMAEKAKNHPEQK